MFLLFYNFLGGILVGSVEYVPLDDCNGCETLTIQELL